MKKVGILVIAGLVFLLAYGNALAKGHRHYNGKSDYKLQEVKKFKHAFKKVKHQKQAFKLAVKKENKRRLIKKVRRLKNEPRMPKKVRQLKLRDRIRNGKAPRPVRVPEPATMLFLGVGLVGLAFAGRKKIK